MFWNRNEIFTGAFRYNDLIDSAPTRILLNLVIQNLGNLPISIVSTDVEHSCRETRTDKRRHVPPEHVGRNAVEELKSNRLLDLDIRNIGFLISDALLGKSEQNANERFLCRFSPFERSS